MAARRASSSIIKRFGMRHLCASGRKAAAGLFGPAASCTNCPGSALRAVPMTAVVLPLRDQLGALIAVEHFGRVGHRLRHAACGGVSELNLLHPDRLELRAVDG